MVSERLAVISLLACHAVLVGWVGFRCSPTMDEPGHLAAGLYIWEYRQFDVYRVNPPLVRFIGATPAAVAGAATDWDSYADSLSHRSEWDLGTRFFDVNGRAAFWYMTLARWAVLPLSLVGAWVCYRWASTLYGRGAGLTALVLWCFCPNVIGLASTITGDAAAAALGAAAGFVFWHWLKQPTWLGAAGAGLMLGVAELTKLTWCVLYALWPLLWLVWLIARRRKANVPSSLQQTAQFAAILVLAVFVINVAYGFQGAFKPLGDYTFLSRTLADEDTKLNDRPGGNRFVGRWLGRLPVPFPEDYLAGIDLQRLDFEEGRRSYAFGRWHPGGFWWFYLYAAALKVPLGTWVLGIVAVWLTVARVAARPGAPGLAFTEAGPAGYRAGWLDELTLLAPALTVFVLVSSQTGLSLYFRYALPCLPFAFIWASKVARALPLRHRAAAAIGAVAVTWAVASSLWVYPHSLSYCNELAGGPIGGHRYLVNSNLDWGQDVHYLKRWLDDHPEASPLAMAYFTFLEPRHFGIQCTAPPLGRGPGTSDPAGGPDFDHTAPLPGWYAMSVHRIRAEGGGYAYFLHFRPTAMAGYSIYLYHITLEEANRVRAELEMPPLAPPAT
jgi:hypothetical protein